MHDGDCITSSHRFIIISSAIASRRVESRKYVFHILPQQTPSTLERVTSSTSTSSASPGRISSAHPPVSTRFSPLQILLVGQKHQTFHPILSATLYRTSVRRPVSLALLSAANDIPSSAISRFRALLSILTLLLSLTIARMKRDTNPMSKRWWVGMVVEERNLDVAEWRGKYSRVYGGGSCRLILARGESL